MGIKNPFRTGAGSAARAARNATMGRQGRAANLSTAINTAFDDPRRESGIQDFMDALRAQRADVTNRGFMDASRRTKFATARSGLTGGSVDASRQRRGLEDVFRRRIDDEGAVQDAGQQLRTRDRSTRQSLLNQAFGVADVGQDAMRGMIAQQGQNANYFSSLLPQLAYDVGNDAFGAYSRRRERDAFLRGAGSPE